MKDFQENLAKKYNYKPLPNKISQDVRRKYMFEIPKFLKLNGDIIDLYSNNVIHPNLLNGYNRIVIGDYGAFIEFEDKHIPDHITFDISLNEEYRLNINHNSKYISYNPIFMDSNVPILINRKCKIYKQKATVDYADYIPGKYYVSVHDVKIKDNES